MTFRTALVTGGRSGIGAATPLVLFAADYRRVSQGGGASVLRSRR